MYCWFDANPCELAREHCPRVHRTTIAGMMGSELEKSIDALKTAVSLSGIDEGIRDAVNGIVCYLVLLVRGSTSYLNQMLNFISEIVASFFTVNIETS
jgi:hypothetical protein